MSKNSVMVQISLNISLNRQGEMLVEISKDFFVRKDGKSVKNMFLGGPARQLFLRREDNLDISVFDQAVQEFLAELFNWLPSGYYVKIAGPREFTIYSDSLLYQAVLKRISELLVFLFTPIFGPDRREDVKGGGRTVEFFLKEAAEFNGPLEDHWSGLENYMPGCPRLSGE